MDKNRIVQIYFIHQNPLQSWKFVGAREKLEGRRITPEAFSMSYYGTRDVIHKLLTEPEFAKALHEKSLTVDALIKSTGAHKNFVWRNRISAAEFRGIAPLEYTQEELREKIAAQQSVDGH